MSLITCGALAIHWLPPEVVVTEAALRAVVHPDEWQKAQGYLAPRRRDEYLRARYLVRWLTGARDPLPATPAGAPSWPPGVVGSVTHKDGYVGVAVAAATDYRAIGIDAEDPGRVRREFGPRLANVAELALLAEAAQRYGWEETAALALLFSFKESVYKAHYPLGERYFYFHDVTVTRIAAQAPQDGAPLALAGSIEAVTNLRTDPWTPSGSIIIGDFVFIKAAAAARSQSAGRQFVLTSVGVGLGPSGSTGSDMIG